MSLDHISESLRPLSVRIDALIPDAANARKHDKRNLDAIKASLQRFGQVKPIVVRADGVVLAGNGTLQAAKDLGWEYIAAAPTTMSEAEAVAYGIADNRTAELAEWDNETLATLLQSLDGELEGTGFDQSDVDTLLASLGSGGGLTDEDAVPEVQPEPICKPGDLWLLGRHRLLCGDSTKLEDVARAMGGVKPHLMVTDPPYGVEYDAAWRDEAAKYSPSMGNRKDTATGKVSNDARADWREAWALFPGDVAYVWHADKHSGTVADSLVVSGFLLRSQIIWAKSHLVISRGDYHSQHEPCWYAVRKSKTGHWSGDRKQTTLWQIDKPMKSETGHSTQKPVECMRRPVVNNSSPGQAVYDPFLGSGTTLIACEKEGRSCIGMEISPAYCDVIIKRWEDFTGNKAELLAI